MRNMSFAHTSQQILDRSKTVTRRLGWRFLKLGDLVQPVEKTMGLKKGERVKRLGPPIRIVSVRREDLWDITPEDCVKEGFPKLEPLEVMIMFTEMNKCEWSAEVTRIEFEYTGPLEELGVNSSASLE